MFYKFLPFTLMMFSYMKKKVCEWISVCCYSRSSVASSSSPSALRGHVHVNGQSVLWSLGWFQTETVEVEVTNLSKQKLKFLWEKQQVMVFFFFKSPNISCHVAVAQVLFMKCSETETTVAFSLYIFQSWPDFLFGLLHHWLEDVFLVVNLYLAESAVITFILPSNYSLSSHCYAVNDMRPVRYTSAENTGVQLLKNTSAVDSRGGHT